MSEDKKPTNEFRIGINSMPKAIITQCEKLIKDENVKDLHLSAVGNTIGELVSIVEILKSIYPNLFQKTVLSTIPATTSDKNKEKKTDSKKLLPKLEVILSIEKISEKNENSVKISEDERQILIDILEKRKEIFIKRRKSRKLFRTNRKWGFNTRKRYSYSAKRTGYNNKRYGFINIGKPYGRNPIRKKINIKKFNGTRKNSGNKQTVTVKN